MCSWEFMWYSYCSWVFGSFLCVWFSEKEENCGLGFFLVLAAIVTVVVLENVKFYDSLFIDCHSRVSLIHKKWPNCPWWKVTLKRLGPMVDRQQKTKFLDKITLNK